MDSSFVNRNSSLYKNPYTFTGRRLDALDKDAQSVPQLLTMYYRHRTYDTYTGRLLQQDPRGIDPAGGRDNQFVIQFQYKNTMALYEYVRSTPLRYVDPPGLGIVPIPIVCPIIEPPLLPPDPTPPLWIDPLPPIHDPAEPPIHHVDEPIGGAGCKGWKNDGNYYKGKYTESGGTGMDVIEAIGPIATIAGGTVDVVLGLAGELGINLTVDVYNVKLSYPKGPGAYNGMPCKCEQVYNRNCKHVCCPRRTFLGIPITRTKKKTRAVVTGYGQAWEDPDNPMRLDCYCSWPDEWIQSGPDYLDKATDCDQFNKK